MRTFILCLALLLSGRTLAQETTPAPPGATAPAATSPAATTPVPGTATGAPSKGLKKRTPKKKPVPIEQDASASPEEVHDGGRGDIAVNVKLAMVSFGGDLTQDKNVTAVGFNAISYPAANSLNKAKGGLLHDYGGGFEMRWMLDYELSAVEQDGDFAVAKPGDPVKVSLLQVAALPCFLAKLSVQLCLQAGLGHMTIYTDDGDYDTSFGTIPYGLMIPYKHDRLFGNLDLTVGLQMQFYEAEPTAGDKTYSASAGSIGFFFGLAF